MSYHKFNEFARRDATIQRLKLGGILALISDAGMPGISDPGTELVRVLISFISTYVFAPNFHLSLFPGLYTLPELSTVGCLLCRWRHVCNPTCGCIPSLVLLLSSLPWLLLVYQQMSSLLVSGVPCLFRCWNFDTCFGVEMCVLRLWRLSTPAQI